MVTIIAKYTIKFAQIGLKMAIFKLILMLHVKNLTSDVQFYVKNESNHYFWNSLLSLGLNQQSKTLRILSSKQ